MDDKVGRRLKPDNLVGGGGGGEGRRGVGRENDEEEVEEKIYCKYELDMISYQADRISKQLHT